ncbi:MAG: type I polyketide synthase [Bacteroidales bacterium]|nr:type I polyketide synthase [Bacteroidales bacterium]
MTSIGIICFLERETIKHFTDNELQEYEYNFNELKNNNNYVKARGVLDNIDKFDAGFFGYNPSDANLTDPQHRIWLETTWHALENAGCDPYTYKGPIGVFAGGYINSYLLNNVLRDSKRLENFIRLRTAESFQVMTASDIAFLPTKTAYQFNLKGPALNIQTACSTSLVSIIEACKSLYSFEADICIAGGVCILTPQETGYIFQEGAIPSPDGHCRPFDAEAKGTVFSNGVGVVVLKRLDDAIDDKDNIIAVVDGWALNNDGNKKVSFTAPSVDGQKEAILAAHSFAGISAEQIGYIETHGTATKLGDPIEIAALTQAFSRSTDKKQFCGIGSVKSNIGHTDAAAGVASFIKACLIAKHKIIPPTLHYKSPNPFINFENSPFFVVDKLKKWESTNKLIIGVSSFGIGGTNAHLLLEEPPIISENKTALKSSSKTYILPFSAKSSFSLSKMKEDFKNLILNNNQIDIDNLAFTLWNGRTHMKYRSSVVLSDLIQQKLIFNDAVLNENLTSIAFMFPGQGAQYFQMGKSLYDENEDFKKIVDEGLELFKSETGQDLKQVLFNENISSTGENKLSETSFTQPALFIIEYALAKVLIDRGIVPSYFIGHSIGEYVAACLSEVFDFQSALRIVIKRGQLMQKMKGGKMFVAFTSFNKLQTISSNLFEIAAENAPENCTISFENEILMRLNCF